MIIPDTVALYIWGFIAGIIFVYFGLNWVLDKLDIWTESEEES